MEFEEAWTYGLSTPLVASGVVGVGPPEGEYRLYHSWGSIPQCKCSSNDAVVARRWPIGAVGMRLTVPPCRTTKTIWILAIRRGQSRSLSRGRSQSRSQNCITQRSRVDGFRRRNPKTSESETPSFVGYVLYRSSGKVIRAVLTSLLLTLVTKFHMCSEFSRTIFRVSFFVLQLEAAPGAYYFP